MESFTIRDLPESTGELVRDAEAIKLFDEEAISLGKAAKLAGVTQSEFINHLAALTIPLARYGADELAQEVTAFA